MAVCPRIFPGLGGYFRSGRKRNFDLQRQCARFRDRLPILRHALQVKLDRLPDVVRDFLDGLSGGDASWQIGDKPSVPLESGHSSAYLFSQDAIRRLPLA